MLGYKEIIPTFGINLSEMKRNTVYNLWRWYWRHFIRIASWVKNG
jgi:hypothetical protein